MQPTQPYRHGACCFASVTMTYTLLHLYIQYYTTVCPVRSWPHHFILDNDDNHQKSGHDSKVDWKVFLCVYTPATSSRGGLFEKRPATTLSKKKIKPSFTSFRETASSQWLAAWCIVTCNPIATGRSDIHPRFVSG
jgi:hypothetical protein